MKAQFENGHTETHTDAHKALTARGYHRGVTYVNEGGETVTEYWSTADEAACEQSGQSPACVVE